MRRRLRPANRLWGSADNVTPSDGEARGECARSRRSALQPGRQCDRLYRARTRPSVAPTACPRRVPLLTGGRGAELTAGQQLAASYHPHPLIRGMRWAGPSRCAPYAALRPLVPLQLGGWTPLCDAAFSGVRRRPSAAAGGRCSGSIRAVSVVLRPRKAAHRCARIAMLATRVRCRRGRRWPGACRRG